jgi:hypothetical protein
MSETFYEHDIDIHMLFMDFKQAFESVRRGELYEVMLRMRILVQIISLVRMTMDNTSAKVKVGNKLGEPFPFNAGVKLFNFSLHSIINKIDKKGTLFLKSSKICAYADDLVIDTRDVNTLKQMCLELEKEIHSFRLSVNKKKTKYTIV